jgi:hypothetical protein
MEEQAAPQEENKEEIVNEEMMDDPPPPARDNDDLLKINNLSYVAEVPCSVCVSREFKEFDSTKESYTTRVVSTSPEDISESYKEPGSGQQIEFLLSSGSRFINPTTSYLKFRVKLSFPRVTSAVGPSSILYEGGLSLPTTTNVKTRALWTNALKRIRWTHACRRDIEDVDYLNHASILEVHRRPSDWRRSIASLFTDPMEVHELTTDTLVVEQDVIIPMDVLLQSWRGKNLLSNRMVSGSRVVITLAELRDIITIRTFDLIVDPGEKVPISPIDIPEVVELDFSTTAMTISNAKIVLDCRELISSIDNLLWSASNVHGSPSAYHAQQVTMSPQESTQSEIFAPSPEQPLGTSLLFILGETFNCTTRNLSRVNAVYTSFIPVNENVLRDFWQNSLYPSDNQDGSGIRFSKHRWTCGFKNWPQQNPLIATNPTKVDHFLFTILNPSNALEAWEFQEIYGSMVLTCRRDQSLETSGLPMTVQRPLRVRGDVLVETPFVWHSGDMMQRTMVDYHRMLNVYGNVLEWRE